MKLASGIEGVPEKTMPEVSDHVQTARADTHAPNCEDPIARRADALSLDPYGPIPPTSADVAGIPAL